MSATVDPVLIDHSQKCRLCIDPFSEGEYRFVICPTTWNRVYNLIRIELQVGEKFSNDICETCNATLEYWEQFKIQTTENQARIYKYEAEMKSKVRASCSSSVKPPEEIVVKQEETFYLLEEMTEEADLLADLKEEELIIKEEPIEQEQNLYCLETFMGEDSSQVKEANTNIASQTEDVSAKKVVTKPYKSFKRVEKRRVVNKDRVRSKPKYPFNKYISKTEKRPSNTHKTRNRIYTEPYDCPYCEEFVTENFLGHIDVHVFEKLYYSCDICDYKSMKKRNLRDHLIWHFRSGLRCAFCSSFFYYMRDRNKHETEVHLKALDGGLTLCPCGASFKERGPLLIHLNKVHRAHFEIKRSRCRFGCGVYFNTVAEYEEHRKTEHAERPCEICGELFPPEAIKYHHRDMHTIHKCPEEGCGQEFKKYSVLLSHRYRAHRHDPKQCSECDAVFPNKLKLRSHVLRVHMKRFACQIAGCDAKFHLILRMATHYYTGRKHKDLSTEERHKFVRELGLDPNVIEARVSKTS